MIRFFQQDTKVMKVIFWIIIVVSCAAMVIFLVPGLFEGQTSSSDTYATIGRGGFLGRFLPAEQSISSTDVRNLAERYLQRQGLPDQLLPFMMPLFKPFSSSVTSPHSTRRRSKTRCR